MIKPLGKIIQYYIVNIFSRLKDLHRNHKRKNCDENFRFERFLSLGNNYNNNDATVCWWMDIGLNTRTPANS